MNDVDRVEEMVRARSTRQEGWLRKRSRRLNQHLSRTPTMKGLYLGAFFVFIGFQLVLLQFNTVNAHTRLSDRKAAAQQIYVAQIVAYGQAVAGYQICLDGVSRSDQNRSQWMQLAEIVEQLDSGNGRAKAFAEQIRTGPLLSAAPRTPADCINPGEPPPPPE